MKKYLSLILIILSITAFSQKDYIGIKGGINFNNLYDIPTEGMNYNFINGSGEVDKIPFEGINFRTGFVGGLSYHHKFKNGILISADFLYIVKGFSSEITFPYDSVYGYTLTKGPVAIKCKYNYTSFPIKIGYTYGEKLSMSINAGLVPSIAKESYYKFPDYNNSTIRRYKNGYMSKYELSVLAEIGLNYAIYQRFLLTTSVAAHQSITTISEFQNRTWKNYGFYWTFGLKYALFQN